MIVTLPDTLTPMEVAWMPITSVMRTRAPYNAAFRALAHNQQMFAILLAVPPLSLNLAIEWQAFFQKMNGSENQFLFRDIVGGATLGSVKDEDSYTARVDGSDQVSASLVTDGWPTNKVDLLKAGDWISVDNCLMMLLDDASSNSLGQASLPVWPRPRGWFLDNDVISVGEDAAGLFRIETFPDHSLDVDYIQSGFEFTAVGYRKPLAFV